MDTKSPPPHHNRRLPLGYEPLDTLQPNPRDPRTYNRADRRRVTASVRRFGPPPLVVTPDRVMLSGNVWLEASKAADYDEAPVLVADHLSPAEADAFMLANVRLVERGAWDQRLLGEILHDLSVGELALELDLTGFEPAEVDLAIEGLDGEPEGPDPADDLPRSGPAVTRAGDLWRLGEHVILCADALQPESYARLMPGVSAAAIVTDPPYNVRIAGNVSGLGKIKHGDFVMAAGEMTEAEFTDFLVLGLGLAAEHGADPSLAYVFMDWRHIHELTIAGRRAFDRLVNVCVWSKTNPGMGAFYRSAHELVFVFQKGRGSHTNNIQLGRFGRSRTNVWSYPGVAGFGRHGEEGDLLALHPTVKPVAMLADIMLDATVRGDVVLDPFAGSGSTIIAAEKVGRRARSLELHPPYVDVAVRRWQRWSGEAAVLDGDGRRFDEVEAARAVEAGQ
jgi:DNA modification methylase